jgi:hypothetical protein
MQVDVRNRTSASAECRHWSEMAVRWSSCAILLSSTRGYSGNNTLLGILIAWPPAGRRRRQSDHIPLGWRRASELASAAVPPFAAGKHTASGCHTGGRNLLGGRADLVKFSSPTVQVTIGPLG